MQFHIFFPSYVSDKVNLHTQNTYCHAGVTEGLNCALSSFSKTSSLPTTNLYLARISMFRRLARIDGALMLHHKNLCATKK